MDNFNQPGLGGPVPTPDGDYLYTEETTFGAGTLPYDPDTRDIKECVGAAISSVPGVLALKGGLTDMFKKDEDLTRGITVTRGNGYRVSVKAKVIAEAGYDEVALIQQMTRAITDDLRTQMALTADKVDIEIADTMTEIEFFDKYDADRALH